MPPKIKVTKEGIIEVALALVRESGDEALNARSLAARLGSSTQPIFSNFENMDTLRREVAKRAHELYLECIKETVDSGKYPSYKASGMGYITFAMREPRLFSLLFMCKRDTSEQVPNEEYDEGAIHVMKNLGLSLDEARLFHFEMWMLGHGIATMAVTSYQKLTLESISDMLSDVYLGLKHRFLAKNDK